ncbi:MAG: alpha/beta fold hydrolase, partial [bacterium]
GLTFTRLAYIVPHADREIPSNVADFLGPDAITVTCIRSDEGFAPGWYKSGTKDAAIVLCHGLGGTRAQLANLARFLNEQGWGVLLIDQCGHGKHPFSLTTFGREEAMDALAAVEWLRDRPEIDPDKIGLFGASMGATTVIYAASQDERLACAVADSSYSIFKDQVYHDFEYGKSPVKIGVRWHRTVYSLFQFFSRFVIGKWADTEDPIEAVKKIECPLFLIHGENDRRIDPSDLWELTDAARDAGVDAVSWQVPGAEHCKYHKDKEFRNRLASFFRKNLDGKN